MAGISHQVVGTESPMRYAVMAKSKPPQTIGDLIALGWVFRPVFYTDGDEAGTLEGFGAHMSMASVDKRRDPLVIRTTTEQMLADAIAAHATIGKTVAAVQEAHKDAEVRMIDEGSMIFVAANVDGEYVVYRVPTTFSSLPAPVGRGNHVDIVIRRYWATLTDE